MNDPVYHEISSKMDKMYESSYHIIQRG